MKCKICEKEEDLEIWFEPTRTQLELQRLCYECLFWMEKVFWMRDEERGKRCVRAKHIHYMFSDMDTSVNGGIVVKFFDGRVVRLCSLWNQGTIPPHFHSLLPDNAEIVRL